MFWFFGKKREVEKLEREVKDSFNAVKLDLGKVSQWIKHIDGKHGVHASDIEQIKKEIDMIKDDMQEIKDLISFFGPQLNKPVFKQGQTAVYKQTGAVDVQTPVQTAVQTAVLQNLTVMERAIVLVLMNNSEDEMSLSYEDLAALLGKNRSTIRGQINTIRQKCEGLIEEKAEQNGKKRLYIPDKYRQFLLKSAKVRVKSSKKGRKDEKIESETG